MNTKKIIASVVAAGAVAGGAAACGSSSGGSSSNTANCLANGDCTPTQQKQLASTNGISNPAGMAGCLVVGNCDPSQQRGINSDLSQQQGGGGAGNGGGGTTASLSWACQIVYGESGGQAPVVEFQATNPSSTAQTADSATINFTTTSGGSLTETYPFSGRITVSANGNSQLLSHNPAPTDSVTGCQVTGYKS